MTMRMTGWMRSGRAAGAALAVVAALQLAACGSTDTTSSAGGNNGGGTPVTVTARDFSLTPSTGALAANAQVTVTFVNSGGVEHSFTLDTLGKEVEADAGDTKTLTFMAPSSGTVAFHCKYHPSSMKGSFTVGAGGPGNGAHSGSSSSGSGGYYGS